MIQQKEFSLRARGKGFWLITDEISNNLPTLPQTGLLNLFIKHTSCALSINENCDPAVRDDMKEIYDRLIKENESFYTHIEEGRDDMPSHAKCNLTGVSLNIPITNGQLNLGIWQGIYLCEFRSHGGSRNIIATIIS